MKVPQNLLTKPPYKCTTNTVCFAEMYNAITVTTALTPPVQSSISLKCLFKSTVNSPSSFWMITLEVFSVLLLDVQVISTWSSVVLRPATRNELLL